MERLTTKIRQKLCRHTRLEFSAWRHEDGKWFIYGTCVHCGLALKGVSFTDRCAELLIEIMEREKENAGKREYQQDHTAR